MNLEQQIKERDEKNSELDSKLNRLHKRAKQRIQEVQKVILFGGLLNCAVSNVLRYRVDMYFSDTDTIG